MGRIALIAFVWFAFWMTAMATLGAITGGDYGNWENRLYSGIFNGAWLAVLTSFLWPWLMPRRLERWMYGDTRGTA